MRSIVVLISGGGSNLQAIIDSIELQKLPVKISLVLSNRRDAFGLERAQKAGIPTAFVDHTEYTDRFEFDQAMIKVIDQYSPDLIVMAGFMRILSEEFINHYANRMINIHPSLLPKYKGLNTHQRALDDHQSHHGATVHFVTAELDSGALILQGKVPVLDNDDADSLQQRVHKIEHLIYPEAVKWFAEGRLASQNDLAYLDGEPLDSPKIMELSD